MWTQFARTCWWWYLLTRVESDHEGYEPLAQLLVDQSEGRDLVRGTGNKRTGAWIVVLTAILTAKVYWNHICTKLTFTCTWNHLSLFLHQYTYHWWSLATEKGCGTGRSLADSRCRWEASRTRQWSLKERLNDRVFRPLQQLSNIEFEGVPILLKET